MTDTLQGWLITGLITILVIIVAFASRKIISKMTEFLIFQAKQEEKNVCNGDDHELLFAKVEKVEDDINGHEKRIIRLELN